MKRKLFFAFALLTVFAALAFGKTPITVTFVNNTGYTVKELYISPTSHDDWYDDLLKGSVVPDGETIDITIPEYSGNDLIYDLMAVDTQGDSYSKYEIDLSNSSNRQIELTFDDYEENPDSSVSDGSGGANGDYTAGYRDGYSAAYKDAYSEAYKEGYKAGLEAGGNSSRQGLDRFLRKW